MSRDVSPQSDDRSSAASNIGSGHPEQPLSAGSKLTRLGVGLVMIAAVLAGTVYGTDDNFPFAPFRMFANADPLNKPVKSTLLEGKTADGQHVVIRGTNTGMRRAEIEGQIPRFQKNKDLMAGIAEAYSRRHPNRPELVHIDVVVRNFELKDGRPTGKFTDEIVLTWSREGIGRHSG